MVVVYETIIAYYFISGLLWNIKFTHDKSNKIVLFSGVVLMKYIKNVSVTEFYSTKKFTK